MLGGAGATCGVCRKRPRPDPAARVHPASCSPPDDHAVCELVAWLMHRRPRVRTVRPSQGAWQGAGGSQGRPRAWSGRESRSSHRGGEKDGRATMRGSFVVAGLPNSPTFRWKTKPSKKSAGVSIL